MTKSNGSWMTVTDFCEELDIARSTFDLWRAKGTAPKFVRLPNGSLRLRRNDFESWIANLEAAA